MGSLGHPNRQFTATHWRTRDGRYVRYEDMHWFHLNNSIKMVLRKLRDGTYTGQSRDARCRDLTRLYDEVHRRCSQRR